VGLESTLTREREGGAHRRANPRTRDEDCPERTGTGLIHPSSSSPTTQQQAASNSGSSGGVHPFPTLPFAASLVLSVFGIPKPNTNAFWSVEGKRKKGQKRKGRKSKEKQKSLM